jgi:3-deoxy-manno-octulosonate cytidylyltransferase (CMP-KDO synthetase)
VVIPARRASTRLPDKPLADIAGVPMIVRVARQASSSSAEDVVVAVDDEEVLAVVREAGFDAVLTAEDHPSGSDRVMEVAMQRGWPADDIVINVQGDEPLLPPIIIDQLAAYMAESENVEIATLSEPIGSAEDFSNPNVVKVLTDANDQALYFSRAPIPFPRDAMLTDALTDSIVQQNNVQRHVGVYAFRVQALQRFVKLTDSRLERIERLEQLRWLEHGRRIAVLQSVASIPGGVDTPQDLARVRQIVAGQSA